MGDSSIPYMSKWTLPLLWAQCNDNTDCTLNYPAARVIFTAD